VLRLAGLVKWLLQALVLEMHAEGIASNSDLACTLLSCFVSATRKAAVALQLPPDRQPAGWEWGSAAQVAGALSALAY